MHDGVTDAHLATGTVDVEVAAADHAALAHAARHHRSVGRHAAAGGQDPLGDVHSQNVLGRCLRAHQDHLLAGLGPSLCGLGVEDDAANGRPR